MSWVRSPHGLPTTSITRAIVDLLKAERVTPEAYVWVHAQNEKDRAVYRVLAAEGVWISLDGVSEKSLDTHVGAVADLAKAGHLGQVLVSQDAGWYHVGDPGAARSGPTPSRSTRSCGALRKAGLGEADPRRLMVDNPARALTTTPP